MQLSRHQAARVQSSSHIETSATVDSTRHCIRRDPGAAPWHPLDRHFPMLLRLTELPLVRFSKYPARFHHGEKSESVQLSWEPMFTLVCSNTCPDKQSSHMQACHKSNRLSTLATCYKVFSTSGGKVKCRHVEMNNSLRRFVNNISQLLENIGEGRHSEVSLLVLPRV